MLPISDNIEAADRDETYYTPPLINIIKFACNGCAEKRVLVTEGCQGCLAHPCVEVCPKGAITLDRYNGRSPYRPGKVHQVRPLRRSVLLSMPSSPRSVPAPLPAAWTLSIPTPTARLKSTTTSVSPAVMCLVNCPFGAIADKSQIFQTIRAIQSGERVYAAVAPAFVGQFGPKVTPGKLRAAMKKLGFADVFEVAIGADLCATQEAEDFIAEVPEKLPFMGTSCCPAWSVMAKKRFPEYAGCISMALTPMVLTARLIKKEHPNGKVVFIGPCAAKKLEAMRRSVRSEVDFVLTFEEMTGIFAAKELDLATIEEDPDGVNDASADGRDFAVAGGVAKAVVNVIKERYPDREIKVANAEGLRDCYKMLRDAVAGKYPGYLLEGMACPGGCVAGAGTMQSIKKSQAQVHLYAKQAKHKTSNETKHIKELEKLVD